MTIVLLEDNHHHAKNFKDWLEREITVTKLLSIKTELEFRERIDSFVKEPPAVFLMDIMVRWTNPSEDFKMPPEKILEEGIYRAGFRCLDLIRAEPKLKHTPVILLSVLGEEELKEDIPSLGENEVLLEKFQFERPLERWLRKIAKTGKLWK